MHEEQREIAGYLIESEIGRGGMGVVYLAHQSFPERKVALKLLSPDLAADPAFRERFVHESNAAASTEHPNIVPVYGAGEADGELYLAMRFIEGTDLGSLLAREGALSPERAARICAEIADALDAAHDLGLIHRDVKPGNILLDARDRAYLTDFGLIRRTQLHTDITKTGQFMGTIDYCAPEQIKGGGIDGRADIYSLGCVLFECLTGAPPFRKDTEVATIYAHLEEDVPKASSKRPGISPVLSGVVTKAMAKRPEDRFATAGEMAEALRGGGPPRRPGRRRRRALALAGTVAVIAALAAAVTLSGDDEQGAGPPSATGGSATGEVAVPHGSLVQLDAETGDVLSMTQGLAYDRGNLPAIEVGEGAVWVYSAGTLFRLDETTGDVVDRITLGTSFGVYSLATAERIVWASAADGVDRVSATDGAVLRPVDIGKGGVVLEFYLAGGAGSVWAVTGDGDLSRIDPQTAEITGEVDAAQTATDITAGFDAVWIADDLQGTVTRVDAETLTAGTPIQISGGIDDVEAGAGAVWVLDSDAGVVTPIDPNTGDLGSPIRVGAEPTDLASGLDGIWVANHGDGTISKVDPITGSVETTFDVGGPVATLAVDASARRVWVTIATTVSG